MRIRLFMVTTFVFTAAFTALVPAATARAFIATTRLPACRSRRTRHTSR